MLIGILLMSCNAKDSNVTNNGEKVTNEQSSVSPGEQVAEVPEISMTEEEQVVATKVGAVSAKKLEDGTFEVEKLVSPKEYEDLMSFDKPAIVSDSMSLVGIVSQKGKWLVPAEYHEVRKIGENAYVGMAEMYVWDNETRHCLLTPLYRVVYKGKEIGNLGFSEDITPIECAGKIRGFLKKLEYEDPYNEEHCVRYFYIDTEGRGHDDWVGVENWSHPHFTNYRIEGNVLTLWGDGFENPEGLRKDKKIPEENKSIYQVDLRTGKILFDPFVPED